MNGLLGKLVLSRRRLDKALAANALLAIVGLAASPLYVAFRFTCHRRAARYDHEHGDFAAAQTHLRVCRSLRPGDAEIHLLLGRASRLGGYLVDAEFRLNLCQQLEGSKEAIALERALLRVQQGRWSPALEEQLQTYIDQDHPDLAAILDALSQGYVRIYRLDSARCRRAVCTACRGLGRGWPLTRGRPLPQ